MALQMTAGVLGEVGRTDEIALEVIGPAMKRTDNRFGLAAALEHDGLAVSTDIREQFGAGLVADEHPAMILMRQCGVMTDLGHHGSMADITWTILEAGFKLLTINLNVKIGVNRKLCCAGR
jgi:hypothetical protein